jgi:hypothetical protein
MRSLAVNGRGRVWARTKDRLAAAHAPVSDFPRPVPAVVRVHNLECADTRAIQLAGNEKVGGRNLNRDELYERAVDELHRLAGLRYGRMQEMCGHVI